jgi:hypothetical protein
MQKKDIALFLLGFFSCALLFYLALYGNKEVPLILGQSVKSDISPSDWINEGDIVVSENYVVIKVANASISSYAPTGSMRPLLDYTSNGIRIIPKSAEDIRVGDIVSFNREGMTIVHRIVDIGSDEEGKYFITQGDNSFSEDEQIRFSDIKYVTIGILW